jgi:transposase
VVDYETGKIIHVGDDRTYKTLKRFLKKFPKTQRNRIRNIEYKMASERFKDVIKVSGIFFLKTDKT